MPSLPLSADRKAITVTHTKIDVLAIDLAKGRTVMGQAVPVLALCMPPGRLDLVDEVLVRIGTPTDAKLDWPPQHLRYELGFKLKQIHSGELRMVGPDGLAVEVASYVDTMQTRRRVYRVSQGGAVKGEAKDLGQLAKLVPLAELREEGSAQE